ncbi:hypothetical protein DITRI_Ditri07aG0027800 [Diplodiscus trichospermus]
MKRIREMQRHSKLLPKGLRTLLTEVLVNILIFFSSQSKTITNTSTVEAVQSPSLPFKCINNIHGCDSLLPSMFVAGPGRVPLGFFSRNEKGTQWLIEIENPNLATQNNVKANETDKYLKPSPPSCRQINATKWFGNLVPSEVAVGLCSYFLNLPLENSALEVHMSFLVRYLLWLIAVANGKLTDGTVFDSSFERGDPIEFELGAIEWEEYECR